MFAFEDSETFTVPDHDMAWTSLSRIERIDVLSEAEKLSLSSGEHPRLVIGGDPKANHPIM